MDTASTAGSIVPSLNHPDVFALNAAPSLGRNQDSFKEVLGRHGIHEAAATPEQIARKSAEQLVSISLVQPLLKQFRGSIQTPPPFGPGPAEKQMSALQDAALAQQMVRASHFPLVDRLARDLLKRSQGAPDALPPLPPRPAA